MSKPIPWLLAAALLAAGCSPQTTPPVQVMAMVLGTDGLYEPKRVTLQTITDITALQGSIARLVGGVRIVVDPNDPLLSANGGNLTDEKYAQVLLKSKGIPVRASYVENNGVLWPADFHSWNMVTTYFNFEKAVAYYQSAGVSTSELSQIPIYYFATFVLTEQSPNPLQDNALFFSPVQAFLVLPFEQLQQVPLPMNFGVIAHEYGHRVFNERAYGGQALPDALTRWSSAAPLQANILKSMDEGLADWNAYGATCQSLFGCDTRFLAASISSSEADARDMARNDKCITAGLVNSLQTLSVSDFTTAGLQYQLGTVLASCLYHAGEANPGQRELLERAVLSAYADPSPTSPGFDELFSNNLNTPQNVTLASVANTILQHIPSGAPDLQTALCNEFMDRLQLKKSDMPACPPSATGGTNCPPLQ